MNIDFSDILSPITDYEPREDLYTAAIIFLATLLLGELVRRIISFRFKKVAEKSKSSLDYVVVKILDGLGSVFFIALAIYLSTRVLDISEDLDKYIRTGTIIVLTFYAIKSVQRFISFLIKKNFERQEKYDESMAQITSTITSAVLWMLGISIVLQNFGYNVTALLGGLGVMGLAFGFAIKDLLADFLSYFSIYFDKPFRVGDFVMVGEDKGTVKKIGVKSTRIKTLKGDMLIIPNQEITSSRINNFRNVKKRGVGFELHITYETSNAKLEKIPKLLETIIEKTENAEFKRVHFRDFGDSALIYNGLYSIKADDYKGYMDVREKVNLAIKKELEKAKIDFAYPTQSVYVKK